MNSPTSSSSTTLTTTTTWHGTSSSWTRTPPPPVSRPRAGSPTMPPRPRSPTPATDEHSRWLRETNAFLQEAMVYLVGSIALKTQKDERRALQCFRKAHELGHARGTFRVGLAHLEGTGGVEKGEELAKAYLRESLDQFVSHQIQDSDYYGNFRQYLENDFRHGALRHPLVLDLLQLYAEQSEDIKKVVDFALERNSARRRNITIAGNLPIFGTTCGTPPASADVPREPTECCPPEATQPADDEAATPTTTTTTAKQQQQQTDEEGTENGSSRGKKSKKMKKEKKEKKEKSEKRAKEKEARRERKKSSGTDKKTDRELKKERKRLEREDKEREKERRREEKKARRSEKDAARRTKEDERRALKRQPSKKINAAAAAAEAT
ncbi:uncharacterized protein ACA1_070820 [Acanthamoeba castellanii str. Neff]|uniref:Uncharacterized protein n=1 Tax=Acanthamoeba castellanii (strain ATCC 30010 / Neff) TaxID=1257118 RepID=L8HFD7_ACACF|nr:uncharacterized protein ACA1_070820 [Acanthamoeba castellanii str. Neff]ELR23463.1 hypothetical protein ACA1_070820 [Acanthamoeba castellanii str. Neff]